MIPLSAPSSGVETRMYRHGHGDCFLLTFRRSPINDAPFHMLIDCGMKKGSHCEENQDINDIIEVIRKQTGGVLDVVAVTHEHEDHVSGFPKIGDAAHPFCTNFTIGELWLAWTEDETNKDANRYRELYGDKLLALALAHHKLTQKKGFVAPEKIEALEDFLELETGFSKGMDVLNDAMAQMDVQPAPMEDGEEGELAFSTVMRADKKIRGKRYKQRLQGLRDLIKPPAKIRFLSPGDGPIPLPGVEGVRVYPFGPPYDQKLLTSLNPRKAEEFHIGPLALGAPGSGLFAAFDKTGPDYDAAIPFASRYRISESDVFEGRGSKARVDEYYYRNTYAKDDPAHTYRRIDGDWLDDAEVIALRLNSEVNNTSLVLTFELVSSGRVLLFTGDAQRGNWLSWKDLSWQVDDKTVTAKDLLARCSLYKVGHHGSHNATLNGTLDDPHPNLGWMAQGPYAKDFVAMVPANKVWAWNKSRPWRHPMHAIEQALIDKAQSRVIVMKSDQPRRAPPFDTADYDHMWAAFEARCEDHSAFCMVHVPDEI